MVLKWGDSIRIHDCFFFFVTLTHGWLNNISSSSAKSNILSMIISHPYTIKPHTNPLLAQMHSLSIVFGKKTNNFKFYLFFFDIFIMPHKVPSNIAFKKNQHFQNKIFFFSNIVKVPHKVPSNIAFGKELTFSKSNYFFPT